MLLVNKSGEEYNLKLNEDELYGNKDTLYLLAEQTGFGNDDVESKHNLKVWKTAAKKAYEELSR